MAGGVNTGLGGGHGVDGGHESLLDVVPVVDDLVYGRQASGGTGPAQDPHQGQPHRTRPSLTLPAA